MKTCELTGAALDWAVAKAAGYSEIKVYAPRRPSDRGWIEVRFNPEPKASTARFDPSVNWEQGGPIIERERVTLRASTTAGTDWAAFYDVPGQYRAAIRERGPTPLIAAMRCYVASKLGDEVNLPAALTPNPEA